MRIFYTESNGTKKEYTSKKGDPITYTQENTEKVERLLKGMRTYNPFILGDLYKQTIECDDKSFQRFKAEYLKAYPKEHYDTKFIQGIRSGKVMRRDIIRLAKPKEIVLGVYAMPNREDKVSHEPKPLFK